MAKRGLGTTFEALIPTGVTAVDFDATSTRDGASDLRHLPLEKIQVNPNQPRQQFDEEELKSLAASIREHGVLSPIVVTPLTKKSGGAEFEIVAGERRYRASKMANLSTIPAIIRTLSQQHKVEVSLIENIQRQDLNPLETAAAMANLKSQFNLTEAAIAERVGKATSTISNQIRLLDLPDYVKQKLLAGALTEGHMRQVLALMSAGASESVIRNFVRRMETEAWNVRRAEKFVYDFKTAKDPSRAEKKKPVASNMAFLSPAGEATFRKHFTARFALPEQRIRLRNSGTKLKLTIEFDNADELHTFEQNLK